MSGPIDTHRAKDKVVSPFDGVLGANLKMQEEVTKHLKDRSYLPSAARDIVGAQDHFNAVSIERGKTGEPTALLFDAAKKGVSPESQETALVNLEKGKLMTGISLEQRRKTA